MLRAAPLHPAPRLGSGVGRASGRTVHPPAGGVDESAPASASTEVPGPLRPARARVPAGALALGCCSAGGGGNSRPKTQRRGRENPRAVSRRAWVASAGSACSLPATGARRRRAPLLDGRTPPLEARNAPRSRPGAALQKRLLARSKCRRLHLKGYLCPHPGPPALGTSTRSGARGFPWSRPPRVFQKTGSGSLQV